MKTEITKFAVLAILQLVVLLAAVYLVVNPLVALVNRKATEQLAKQVEIEYKQQQLDAQITAQSGAAQRSFDAVNAAERKLAQAVDLLDATNDQAHREKVIELLEVAGRMVDEHKDAGRLMVDVADLLRRFRSGSAPVKRGDTTIDIANPVGGALWWVRVDADQYDHRYLLLIAHNGYGEPGHVTVLARMREYENAEAAKPSRYAWGAPRFSVDKEGRLVVTNNWPDGGVNLRFAQLDPS